MLIPIPDNKYINTDLIEEIDLNLFLIKMSSGDGHLVFPFIAKFAKDYLSNKANIENVSRG